MFDGFVTMLVQELRHKPIRYHLCDKEARKKLIEQLVTIIFKGVEEKNLKIIKFTEICENFKTITLKLKKSDLPPELAEM